MSRIVTTTLVQPKPTISLDDKGVSVKANDIMTYTLIYSNASAATGATTGTFSITLNYAPYVSFITYTAAPANPPIRACEELDGRPKYQVSTFHPQAPASAPNTT